MPIILRWGRNREHQLIAFLGGGGVRVVCVEKLNHTAPRMQNPSMPMQKRGGEVHVKEHVRRANGGHVSMEAGAGGGEGRIEKMHEYGSGRGFKPKKVPIHA